MGDFNPCGREFRILIPATGPQGRRWYEDRTCDIHSFCPHCTRIAELEGERSGTLRIKLDATGWTITLPTGEFSTISACRSRELIVAYVRDAIYMMECAEARASEADDG
jgi:hypothetical protein